MIMPKDVIDRMNDWIESKEGKEAEKEFVDSVYRAALRKVVEAEKT